MSYSVRFPRACGIVYRNSLIQSSFLRGKRFHSTLKVGNDQSVNVLLSRIEVAAVQAILKFYQYKLDSAQDGFKINNISILTSYQNLYRNGVSRNNFGTYFEVITKLIKQNHPLSEPECTALEKAMNSSIHDVQLHKVSAIVEEISLNSMTSTADSIEYDVFDSRDFDKYCVEDVKWTRVEDYVVDRVGPVQVLIDDLSSCDTIVVTDLNLNSVLSDMFQENKTIDSIERINLPISSWEKEIYLIYQKTGERTLLFSRIKGENYLTHYMLLIKRYLKIQKNEASLKMYKKRSPNIEQNVSLNHFVNTHKDTFAKVNSLVFGYFTSFRYLWGNYYEKTIKEHMEREWTADFYKLPNGHKVAVLATRLPMHGELLANNFHHAIKNLSTIQNIFMGGTAGSLTADVPYKMIFPSFIQDVSSPVRLPNVLSTNDSKDRIPQVHTSVVSSLIETPTFLEELKSGGITSIDMEGGYLARMLKDNPQINLGLGFIITDFPRHDHFTTATLFSKDMQRHSPARNNFPRAIYNYLQDGKRVHSWSIEEQFGPLGRLAKNNMDSEKTLLGELSDDELKIKERLIHELNIGFFIRATKSRLWHALKSKLFLSPSLLKENAQAQLRPPTTPLLENQIYGAYDYVFGVIGTANNSLEYGDVVIELKEDYWTRSSWASKYSGWWSARRLEVRQGIKIINEETYTIEDSKNLEKAQHQFSQWLYTPDHYRDIIALLTVSHLRHKTQELQRKFLTSSTSELHELVQENNFAKLEGKIYLGFEIEHIKQVILPQDTPSELQELLKQNDIPFKLNNP